LDEGGKSAAIDGLITPKYASITTDLSWWNRIFL